MSLEKSSIDLTKSISVYSAWNQASAKLRHASTKDDLFLQKEDVLRQTFQELGTTSAETETRSKVKEKIYHQWAELYKKNHEQVQSLRQEISSFIDENTKKISTLKNKIENAAKIIKPGKEAIANTWRDESLLSSQLKEARDQAIELEEKLNVARTTMKTNMENLDSAARFQGQMLNTIHARLAELQILEKQMQFVAKHPSYSKVILKKELSLLKQEQNDLKNLEKEWLHPSKLKELAAVNHAEQKKFLDKPFKEKINPINENIAHLNSEIEGVRDRAERKFKKAFLEAFQQVPLRTPKNLKAITDYIKELQQLDPENKEIYDKLYEQTVTQFSFFESVAKDLKGCFESDRNGKISLGHPSKTRDDITGVIASIKKNMQNYSKELESISSEEKHPIAAKYVIALKNQLKEASDNISSIETFLTTKK